MSYSVIVQTEGPFSEYGDGTFRQLDEAIERTKAAVKLGAYLSGDKIEIVNDKTGKIARTFRV